MDYYVIVMLSAVGIPGVVALMGSRRGRYRDGLVVCALIPIVFAVGLTLTCLDGFFSDPVALWKDDIVIYGPPYAIIVLPFFLLGLISLIRLVRQKPRIIEPKSTGALGE